MKNPFSEKKENDENLPKNYYSDDDKSCTCPDAEEVTVSPTKEVGTMTINSDYLRKLLVGKMALKGKVIDTYDDFLKPFKEGFKLSPNHAFGIELYVVDTKPEGEVEIREKTKINYLSVFPGTDGFPASKTLSVKKLPDLKKLTELKDIMEMRKILMAGNFINKYEDDKQVIYFAGNYFYRKIK